MEDKILGEKHIAKMNDMLNRNEDDVKNLYARIKSKVYK